MLQLRGKLFMKKLLLSQPQKGCWIVNFSELPNWNSVPKFAYSVDAQSLRKLLEPRHQHKTGTMHRLMSKIKARQKVSS